MPLQRGVAPGPIGQETADSAAGVGLFDSMGRVLEGGVTLDMTATACGFMPAVMTSAVDYDLVAPRGEDRFLGARDGDLATERPDALIRYSLRRMD